MGVSAPQISATLARSTPPKTAVAESAKGERSSVVHALWHSLWVLALLLLIPLRDTQAFSAQAMFDRAYQLFQQGDLIKSQTVAEQGYRRFRSSDLQRAVSFQLLLARVLIWRGKSKDALETLAVVRPTNREARIEALTLKGVANTYLPRFDEADRQLAEARELCQSAKDAVCGSVPIARGILAIERGRPAEAKPSLLEGLSLARLRQDRRSETSALLNLSVAAGQTDRYDEALDWGNAAYRIAVHSGWQDLTEDAQGNLGWAYFGLGDKEKALELFLAAEQTARRLGNLRFQLKWISTAAYVYRDQGNLDRATLAYRNSLELAQNIRSQQDIINALEDLAHTHILSARLDDADAVLSQLAPMVSAGNRLDQLDVMLARGEIAAARHQDQQAEALFRTVEHDPASQTSMRLGAEHRLARLYEVQGNAAGAEEMYRTALSTFEAARADLKNEESKLPFLANATPIYDDYIRFLVKQGRSDEALAAADQSRARTLAQGLDVAPGKPQMKPAAFRAVDVARKSGSSVLFYWLGEKESYLWAITAKKTSLYTLPAQRAIAPLIERYRQELLQPAVARQAAEADGAALFGMLVAPAEGAIPPSGNVVVVCDGALSLLNFETLLAPGSTPHYWIEDVNVTSAPSLYMLAAAKTSSQANKKLLLMGDAVSPNPDYPRLPMARAEMQKIGKHFAPADATVFERQAATSSAYLRSRLREYAYIHFVAHGVASRTDPLDSAIILSRTGAAEDSFKLHAREILQHPIDARLVTISACYGGGTRSFAGEGLVGLSWAFLRAGAHNVIGALWEASDDSTPQLMDKMYAGLADGMSPSAALRQAKLAMLHSEGKFQQPFYWAPFQMYAGL